MKLRHIKRLELRAIGCNRGCAVALIGRECRNEEGDLAVCFARRFHVAYERLAPDFRYETRPETRVFDAESANGRLMVAICRGVLEL